MYKIVTSIGHINLKIIEELSVFSMSFHSPENIFNVEDIRKLQQLYTFDTVTAKLNSDKTQYFLTLNRSWANDDYNYEYNYGSPEYLIISNEEETKIKNLEEKIIRLKNKLHFQPGGKKYHEIEKHFIEMLNT